MTDLDNPELQHQTPGTEQASAPITVANHDHTEFPVPSRNEVPWYKKPVAKIAAGVGAVGLLIGAGAALSGDGDSAEPNGTSTTEPQTDVSNPPTEGELNPPAAETSEILASSEIPADLFINDEAVTDLVAERISNNSPENIDSTTSEERNFSMWRGVVIFETVDPDGNQIFVRLNNPIEVLIDDPTQEHDQIALWAAYHATSGRFITVERGYRDSDGSSDYNSGELLRHWDMENDPNSGQEVTGKPRQLISGMGLELGDNFGDILRPNETDPVISNAQVFTGGDEAFAGLYHIVDLGGESAHRDNDAIRELDS